MIRVQNLKFKRGDELLFENLSFVVHPGQQVAIAGRNGAGKSTLFNLILGRLTSDEGDVEVPSHWRISCMAQEVELTDQAAIEFVIDGHQELRRVERQISETRQPERLAELHGDYQDLGGYEAEATAGEILHGLGFTSSDFTKPFAEFSGGWRIRLGLARALMTPCDLLLLDEPTNHLDLEAILWLENWLDRFTGTVLLIAHDRAFLDNCVDHTLYLSHRSGELYKGNYSSSERQRAERMVLEQALQAKREAQAAHIQKFVDRFRAKASKAKQVQSRIKALERMQVTATLALESPYSIAFNDPSKVSNPLYSIRKLELGYDTVTVLSDINQTVLPGARIGVLGANGAGKSTLLKALVGELSPLSGELTRGQHAKVGYFAQHQLETLDASDRALPTMQRQCPQWTEQRCRDYLGGWGFTGQMITRPISTLSGGEKARLVLALLATEDPAVLVLDEPTNHLDLDMRDALVLALQDYAGAVIIVSHDRNLLAQSVDEFWILEQGRCHVYRGDLADYTTATKSAVAGSAQGSGKSGAQQTKPADERKVQRQARAQQRQALKSTQNELRKVERKMEAMGEELRLLEQRLADKETYDRLPAQELNLLIAKAGKQRQQLEQLEQRWLDLSTQLDESTETV